jgi:hypothetical protein
VKAVAAVLVVFASLAVVFGAYRWTRGDDERDRAEAAANEFAAYFGRAAEVKCDSSKLEPLPDDSWRFHLACGDRGSRCLAVDLDQFRVTRKDSLYVAGNVEGVTDVRCSADSWTPREAAQRLVESPWARQRKARFISCTGPAEMRYAPYNNRFGCRYSSPRGDGYILIHTTGADTFEIESKR